MMKTLLQRAALATAAASALLLAGCWDDDGTVEEPAPVTEVPLSATASPEAWTAYVRSLTLTEGGTPLGLRNVDRPPVTDSGAPAAL